MKILTARRRGFVPGLLVPGLLVPGILASGVLVLAGADIPQTPSTTGPSAGALSVIQMQPFRQASTLELAGGGRARLVNLNPATNAWFVLSFEGADGKSREYVLENPDPQKAQVQLEPTYQDGLVVRAGGRRRSCPLWNGGEASQLAKAAASGKGYAELCGGVLYLRNQAKGRRTRLEWTTDFLRDHVKGGEAMTSLVKDTLFKDAFRATSEVVEKAEGPRSLQSPSGAPPAAAVDAKAAERLLEPSGLGITVAGAADGMRPGRWYGAQGLPGIFLSAVEPGMVRPGDVPPGSLAEVDAVGADALAFLTAFDLERFELAFTLGTDHPRLGWSERVPENVGDRRLPGPDGVGSMAPLTRTGQVPPWQLGRVTATFTGGFKRTHGAFRFGRLSTVNSGSHYGFIEEGTILSRLQPGLSTVLVHRDGRVALKTWNNADSAFLQNLRFARQNGVALVERDEATGRGVPGALVKRWGEGNWSGSQDRELRTLRAGLCLREEGERRYLIYGYFSTATPSAMARVFLAYGCNYAMHLDMNALEHTYLAVYRMAGEKFVTQHLVKGMEEVDTEVKGGERLPRFVAVADDRDFFYLSRKVEVR